MDQDEATLSDLVQHIEFDENGTVLEFGVGSGNMGSALLNVIISAKKPLKKYIGFDWFKGLPEESKDVPIIDKWYIGAFNILDENRNNSKIHSKASTVEEALSMMYGRFNAYKIIYGIDIIIIEELYEHLKSDVVHTHSIKPANYISIDCDLYISAKHALEFIIQNNLMADNCIIRYDDWDMGIQEGLGGESKAHNEMVAKYGLVFELIRKKLGSDAVFRFNKKESRCFSQ